MQAVVDALKAFAEALDAHPQFELIVYNTFPPITEEDIGGHEEAFFGQIMETDDWDEPPLPRGAAYFVPFGDPKDRQQLVLPTQPARLDASLRQFYQTTNGLQLLWHYKGLANSRITTDRFHQKVEQGVYNWRYTHLIDHHWSIGSIMIKPCEQVLSCGVEDANLYWSDKDARKVLYPVVPFDFYDDWATAALIMRGEVMDHWIEGEDAMASFQDSRTPKPIADYLQGLLHHKGSILIRNRGRYTDLAGTDWSLDQLAAAVDRWQTEEGRW